MSRRMLPLLLIVALFALSAPVLVMAQEPVTITWLACGCWGGDVAAVAADFMAENPDINVEVIESAGFDDLFQQIQVQLGAGDTTPDVFAVDGPLTASYALRGWLLPLDDAFTDEEKADWLPSSLEAGMYNGQLVSAPQSTSTQLLYYNADRLEAAGITPPGPDERWTWEQIAEVAPQLTTDEDGDGTPEVWGFIWEQYQRIYQLQPLPVSLGGQSIGEDSLTVEGIINSPEWIEAFTYYYDMFNTLRAAPQGDASLWPPDIFETGNLAMFVGGPWDIPRFAAAELPFEWGVARHPYFEEGEVVTPTGSWHVGINSLTEYPEEAKRFVNWLTTGEGAEIYWRKGSSDFPAQQSVLELFQTSDEFAEEPLSFLRVAADEATQNPVPRPLTVGYLEYEQILADTFQDIRNGADVTEALNTAAARIESEMAKYR